MGLLEDLQDVIKKNKLDGYVDGYIYFDVLVDKIVKDKNIQDDFSEYVKKHDYKEGKWDFVLEEVKQWEKEIEYFYSSCDDKSLSPEALINVLKNNNVSAYKLNYAGPREGSPIEIVDRNKEILYIEDGVTGWIRCYESEQDRIIIKWIGSD